MVAPEQEKVFRVLNLVGEEEADALDGFLAPVDIVPQKQIVDVAGEAALLEDLEQVVVLAMDITYG